MKELTPVVTHVSPYISLWHILDEKCLTIYYSFYFIREEK